MNTTLLIIFCLLLLAGLCQVVFFLRRCFSPSEQVRRLNEEVLTVLSMSEIQVPIAYWDSS